MRRDRRDPPLPRCHITIEAGDSRAACGRRSDEVPTTWARWIGTVEVGHMRTGFPLPDWCADCLLALYTATVADRKKVPTQAALFDSQR